MLQGHNNWATVLAVNNKKRKSKDGDKRWLDLTIEDDGNKSRRNDIVTLTFDILTSKIGRRVLRDRANFVNFQLSGP